MSSSDALIVALPPRSALADGNGADASAGDARATDAGRWWRVIDGQITQSGDRLGWLHPSAQRQRANGPLAEETQVMAIAPAADVMLHRAAFPKLAPKQAEAAAKLLVAEASITPASALHVALGAVDDADGARDIAMVDNGLMAQWMAWAARHGLTPDSIIPAAMVLPVARQDDGATGPMLVRGQVGDEMICRGADVAFVADPVLVDHIIGSEGRVQDISAETIERAMVDALDTPPIEMRCGAWAKAPPALFDAAMLRRAAMLGVAILIVSLLILFVRFLRIEADTAALDAKAASDVASVLRPAPAIDQAIPQLDARLATLGGGTARLSAPFAALVSAMEPAPTVAVDTLGWRGDGTLAVTLGAPRAEDINVVLLALQARGYSVTATPRSGSDGRALGDITIRSAP